jgi:hypothetical protein
MRGEGFMEEGLICRCNCCTHSVPLSSNWPYLGRGRKKNMVPCLNIFCAKNTILQWCPAFQEDTECCDTDKENNHIPVEEWILLQAEK